MEVVILIGLQGAGKSTFARTVLQPEPETWTYISKDLFPNNRRPARRQHVLLEEALREGRSALVDNTNPTKDDRADVIALGKQYGAEIIGYWFTANLKSCLKRNQQRSGRAQVPDVALFSTVKKLEPPAYSEGFDALFCVQTNRDLTFTVSPL
ncbi:putative kinase [Thermosporothrix hazakensis]|jgi:predicted kinase|uniref:Kinase n=2 Tax=Thermosporothrix TaxID=768650 RepID=A0A455SK77_9CHLR|nr:ATP-binding protein [Thermosporothrix hazakensis]PZW36406.1 putative kinase [Thermosporothrix hazakensis]BBH88873.1 hypothetical protein KTC_36240 [Thermosporothrix sp. COM3]GCE47058.1 hypothetical protein KTH_19270 [Thermosporothrix hazakensis]